MTEPAGSGSRSTVERVTEVSELDELLFELPPIPPNIIGNMNMIITPIMIIEMSVLEQPPPPPPPEGPPPKELLLRREPHELKIGPVRMTGREL